MIAQRARLIFAAYRRDDYADADMFVLQLGMVLERYPDDIIHIVTDPRTGIQRRCKYPPSIADVADACEAEATAKAKRKHYEAMGRVRRQLPAPPRDRGPGALANCHVPRTSPHYDSLAARAREADPIMWRIDDDGIWVPTAWVPHRIGAREHWRPFAADELAALYPPRAAPAQESTQQKEE